MTRHRANTRTRPPAADGRGSARRGDAAGRRTSSPSRNIDQQVIRAAAELFFQGGFDATTTDAISVQSRISKRTLYKHFGSKTRIFEAVIREEILQQIGGLELVTPHSNSLYDRLVAVADHLLGWLLTERIANLERTALSQILRFPRMAANIHEFGFQRAAYWVSGILGAANAAGEIEIRDPVFAAEQFVTVVVLAPMRQSALGLAPPTYGAAARENARRTVRLFLEGCRCGPIHADP